MDQERGREVRRKGQAPTERITATETKAFTKTGTRRERGRDSKNLESPQKKRETSRSKEGL